MPFHEHIREYREQLEITQIEAAERLGIDHSVLSKYELGKLAIPLDLLPDIRRVYAIPKEKFIDMLEDKLGKSRNPGLEARENKIRYAAALQNEYMPFIMNSKEFRLFMSKLNALDKKDAKKLLTEAIKNN